MDPYDQTEIPYRQLIVDIVQATFAATYRTGDWPRRFRSHAAKEIAAAMADRLATGGRSADGATATRSCTKRRAGRTSRDPWRTW